MSNFLPPLANVIAMHSRDPDRLRRFVTRVESDPKLKKYHPAPNWIAAFHTLPLSVPDAAEVLQAGFVFAEGREDVSARHDPLRGLRSLNEALDHPDAKRLAQIPGDFTFFRFKPDGAVTAVRSCGGLVPVYILESADGLVLSTHATWLAKYAGWRGEPDWLITAMWLSGWPIFAKNRSHLDGVKILHKGERFDAPVLPPLQKGAAAQRRGDFVSPQITRYWYPPKASELRWPTKKIEQEHQEEFRSILIGSLRQNLDPDGNNLLALSGGVDSASLLALTAGHLKYPVKTFSLIPPKSARFYEREMGYLNALWNEYGVEHKEIELRSEAELDLTGQLPPLLFPMFNPSTLALIGPWRDVGIRVSFGGEFADEVVGSMNFTLPDWARHVSVWRLPLLLARVPRVKRLPLFMFEQQITRRFNGRVAAPFPGKFADWISAELEPPRAALQTEVESEWAQAGIQACANPTLWLRTVHLDFQPMQWEICSWLSVRRFSPFSTRPMQELALRCHPVELLGPHSKRMTRGALGGLVPSQFLERGDKGSFGRERPEASRPETAVQALRAAGWERLLGPGALQVGEGAKAYVLTLAGCYASRYRFAFGANA
jgi:asparagine synthetase B (glutamine-hydrolysing)